MPIYEYECRKCHRFQQRLVKHSKRDDVTCEHCQSGDLQRKVSASSFHLKGGGWYKGGYESDASSNQKSEG